MLDLLGQPVLKIKTKSSYDREDHLSQNARMAKRDRASDFRSAFVLRTKEARLRSGRTQEEMATMLGVAQDTYKQWETRNPMPIELIPAFCLAARISEKWLLTGRENRDAAE